MTEPELLTPVDGEAILANAQTVRPMLAAAGEEIDAARRLPEHIVALLKRTGVFRFAFPKTWGGPEVDPMMQIRIIAALSAGNGSAGWCAMIGSDAGFLSAFMDQDSARAMWPDIDLPIGVTAFPPGKAVVVEGGYRLTGRWPYGSGCQHSGWMGGNCVIIENGAPRMLANGQPATVIPFVRAGEFEIFDTWDTTGLRGSGSHDWGVTDYFVPENQTADGLGIGKSRREGPLYALPMWFLANQAGVPIGLAHGALDAAIEILRSKKSMGAVATAGQPHIHHAIGHAIARLGAAEAYVFATVTALWELVCSGARPTSKQFLEYRLCNTHAHKECLAVVDSLYEACSGSALYLPNAMDRYMRDMRTANQHVVASAAMYFDMGKAVLEVDRPQAESPPAGNPGP